MLMCSAFVIPVYPFAPFFCQVAPPTCSSRVISALGNSHYKLQCYRPTRSHWCASPAFSVTSLEPKNPANSNYGLKYFCRNTSKTQPSDQGEDYCLLHAQTRRSLGRVNDVPSKRAGRRPVESNRGLEGLPAHLHTPQSL